MKTLIVYDSKFGNTRALANAMAEAIGPNATVTDCEHFDLPMLEGVELLVLGSPTQRWTASPLARDVAFVIAESISSQKLKIATFDTGFAGPFAGSGAEKLADMMREAGFEVVVEPEHFLIKHRHGPIEEGETTRARDWAKMVAA